MSTVVSFLARYDALDAALVAAGFPATSQWWRKTLERYFRSGKRQLVVRVGRRGGKSSTLCRLAVAWALWGQYSIPPGDVGVVAFISVSRDESSQRLRTVEAILVALAVPYSRSGDTIELQGKPVLFKTFTASVSGVSGFTGIMVIGDELAKWRDAESGSNPAREVLGSVRPTVATQPHAPLIWSSSAYSRSDHHYALMELGETAAQTTAEATSWEANPSLTEQATRDLEPDERVWSREYANVPSDGVLAHWFGETALQRSIAQHVPQPIFRSIRYTIAADPAFASDRFGWAVVSRQFRPWEPEQAGESRANSIIRVHEVGAWKPDRSPREMWRRLHTEVCRPYRHDEVLSDQHHGESSRELARDVGIRLRIVPWVGGDEEGSKTQRHKRVRNVMLEGNFEIPNDESLIREFRRVRGTLLASGGERIEVPRNADGHGDRIAAIVLAASEALERYPEHAPETWDEAEFHRQYIAWSANGNLSVGSRYGGHPVFASGRDGRDREGNYLYLTNYPDFRRRYPYSNPHP